MALDIERLKKQAEDCRKKAFSFRDKSLIRDILFQFGKELFNVGYRDGLRSQPGELTPCWIFQMGKGCPFGIEKCPDDLVCQVKRISVV